MPEQKALPSPNQAVQPAWYGYDAEQPDQSSVPLSHYLWILRRHRWKILGFVLGCVAATIIISARLTPVYESTVIVDIDRQMPSAAIGQDATRMPANDADQFLATQVKIIQSDSVLRPSQRQFLRNLLFNIEEMVPTRGCSICCPMPIRKERGALRVKRPASYSTFRASTRAVSSTSPSSAFPGLSVSINCTVCIPHTLVDARNKGQVHHPSFVGPTSGLLVSKRFAVGSS